LHAGLRWAAAWLDDGYYGLKHRGETTVTFRTGEIRPGPVQAGAAHFAVARYLALGSAPAEWEARMEELAATYTRLFGPMQALPPPLPDGGPAQPPLLLPWPEGERWHFTGGPHGAWGVATAWGAVDFAPPSSAGCSAAPDWVVASAPGIVAHADRGLVLLDLDDGFVGSGWVLAHLHIAADGRASVGDSLATGDRIGHPSCEGGSASGAHVHLARRFNGEWVPAEGRCPLELSGWRFTGGAREYEGRMVRDGDPPRTAVASGGGGRSDVVSDNGPGRWAALGLDAAPAVALPDAPGSATGAFAGGLASPGISLALQLEGRRDHATPLILALSRGPGQPTVLMGRTDATGRSGPIAMPALPAGEYTVTVRAPGFRPRQVFEVPVGPSGVTLDLTGGGLTPFQAGELNGDDLVDARDALAWFGHWLRRAPRADLDGDGRGTLGDLSRLLANRGGRSLRP
jgi:hypothetical protein